jgi:hypothetical protein
MIALKSPTSDGSEFLVYDDDNLIGHIRKLKGLTGNRYMASIERNGEEESNGKEYDSPDDALRWIEMQR